MVSPGLLQFVPNKIINVRSSLNTNAMQNRVIFISQQLSSFRSPTLWFIHLTVTTCHIQYTFLSLSHLFHEKMDKTWKYTKSAIFMWYKNGRRRFLGVQSINTDRASSRIGTLFVLKKPVARQFPKPSTHCNLSYSQVQDYN